jgi:hypothetical protein
LVTHSLLTRDYGCIVVTGVGDADVIGETVGTGCALAVSVTEAPATNVAARIIPANHRFIAAPPSVLLKPRGLVPAAVAP